MLHSAIRCLLIIMIMIASTETSSDLRACKLLFTFLAVLQFHKPEYARKPIVQDTFYRRTTAFAPQGGVAVAASG